MDGYEALKRVAGDHPEWLEVARVCYEFATEQAQGEMAGSDFAGSWILERLGRPE